MFLLLLALLAGNANAAEKVVKFKVESIMCGGCVAGIKETINGLDGVSVCDADEESKVVVVTFNEEKVTANKLRTTITSIGHSVENYKTGEVVAREILYWSSDLKDEQIAAKVRNAVAGKEGIISITPDLAKKLFRIEYDAVVVKSKDIKKALVETGLATTRHWNSVRGKSLSFNITQSLDKLSELDKKVDAIPVRDGVWDHSSNYDTKTLALTFDFYFTSIRTLLEKLDEYKLEVLEIEE
jgi:copper chaperone CopZ